jgi:phosphate uptake regulator
MSNQRLNEGILNRFIDAFFDSYQRGLEKSFHDKVKKRDPELAKRVEKLDKELDELRQYLQTLEKK